MGCQSSPESYSETVSQLRNMCPRSTQNKDVVSSINFLDLSVSCPIILLFESNNIHITKITVTMDGRGNNMNSNRVNGETIKQYHGVIV